MPGHFEVYLDHPDESASGWRWRFVDEDGREFASSSRTHGNAWAASRAAAEFVLAIRAATYGQRFVAEIADAVTELDL